MGHADYTKGTGNGGIMLIRVADAAGTPGVILGNEVQFHIRSGLSGTYVGSPGFRWDGYIDGHWASEWDPVNWRGRIGNISGTAWRHVANFDIRNTQDVCFRIDGSGTQGFGGPTDFWVRVNRTTASKPPAPTNLGLDQITHAGMRFRFQSNGDGGSPIIRWEYQCSEDPAMNVGWATSTGTTVRTDLKPGRLYYWRARGVNALGAGSASPIISARTLAGGRVKVAGVYRDAVPMVKVAGVWKTAIPLAKQSGSWKNAS